MSLMKRKMKVPIARRRKARLATFASFLPVSLVVSTSSLNRALMILERKILKTGYTSPLMRVIMTPMTKDIL